MPPLQVVAALLQDNSYLSASADFKLTGLNAFFGDDSDLRNGKNEKDLALPQFGPGLSFVVKLAPAAEPEPPDQNKPNPIRNQRVLGLYFYAPQDESTLPITIHASVEVLSFSAQKIAMRSFQWTYTKGQDRGHGWKRLLTRKLWEKHNSMRSDDGVLLRLRIQSPPGPNASASAVATVLHKTICSSDAVARPDIRFTVFDQRDVAGRLGNPRSLLADGKVIQDSCKVLSQGIFPADITNGRWCGIRVEAPIKDDTYASYGDLDSDFEEDEPDDDSDLTPVDESSSDEPTAKRPKFEQDDTNEHTERTAADDLHKAQPIIKQDVEENRNSVGLSDTANHIAAEESNEEDNRLDVVIVGASSATWEALLFYLYTGTIEFAPLSSSGRQERNTYVRNHHRRYAHRPNPCSPKSMYRLASELDLTSLQKACLRSIKGQLTTTNIIPEIFTSFTAKYEDVKRAEIAYLVQHWTELKDSDAFQTAMGKLVQGAYPHAGGLLKEIFQAVGNNTVGA